MNHFSGLTLTLKPKETTEIDSPGLIWEQNHSDIIINGHLYNK